MNVTYTVHADMQCTVSGSCSLYDGYIIYIYVLRYIIVHQYVGTAVYGIRRPLYNSRIHGKMLALISFCKTTM